MISLTGRTKEQVEQEKIENEWVKVRNERDRLLKETDWCVLPDSPLTMQQKDDIEYYRQQLRNIPQNFDDPFEVQYPERPNWL